MYVNVEQLSTPDRTITVGFHRAGFHLPDDGNRRPSASAAQQRPSATCARQPLLAHCCTAGNGTERLSLALSAETFLWGLSGSHECDSAIVRRDIQLTLRPTHATTTARAGGWRAQQVEWFDRNTTLSSGSCQARKRQVARVRAGVSGRVALRACLLMMIAESNQVTILHASSSQRRARMPTEQRGDVSSHRLPISFPARLRRRTGPVRPRQLRPRSSPCGVFWANRSRGTLPVL